MSVDTYLKGKNTSRYQVIQQSDIQILVAFGLPRFIKQLHLDVKRFLLWRSFAVEIEAQHVHGPRCRH